MLVLVTDGAAGRRIQCQASKRVLCSDLKQLLPAFRLTVIRILHFDPMRLIVVRGGIAMKRYTRYEFDNRDAAQMYDYMESRIDALKRRIVQLEDENRVLRLQIQ